MAGFEDLMKAIQDPKQREQLATKAAASGPPPDSSMGQLPNIPGVQAPPQPNPQLYGGLAGIGNEQPAGDPEENKSKWLQFMDNLADPEGPALPLLNMGAKLLQPRMSGTTQAGVIGEAGADFANMVAGRRAQQKEGELKEREIASREQLAEAQAGKAEAETAATERDTESADIMDDLAKARAELARAQAGATGKGGSEREVIFNTTANALFRSYPDKYKTLDEAKVALRQFEITKGDTPASKAITGLMENLPYMQEERVQPTLDLIQENLGELSAPPAGATAEREQELAELRENAPPIDSFPDSEWLSLEGVKKPYRDRLEKLYGKEAVARKIAEAKARQGQ